MTEPVDLDVLEHWIRINVHSSQSVADCGIKTPEANRFIAAIEELRELRAWKERLGPVEDWFPLGSKLEHCGQTLPNGPCPTCDLISEIRAFLERAKEES